VGVVVVVVVMGLQAYQLKVNKKNIKKLRGKLWEIVVHFCESQKKSKFDPS
jgi:CDP-diacylglycerol pyrophosphatase